MEIDQSAFTTTNGSNTQSSSPPHPAFNSSNHFPRKRPLRQDDPFFQEGTYEYKAAWLRLENENAYIPDIVDPDDSNHGTMETHSHLTPAQACYVGQCHGERTYPNAAAYEHHYETNHRHICETCRKPFPGEKWLELHLREVHDVMIKIRQERGEKTYQCFVEGCDRVCSTPKKRQMHLIDKHQYPKRFNFSIILTGVVPFGERMKQVQREKALWESRERGRQKANEQASKSQHQKAQGHGSERGPGSMEIDPAVTTSTYQDANRRGSLPSKSGSAAMGPSAMAPKKNTFRQYRTSEHKPAFRKRSITVDHDMDMDPMPVPLEQSKATSGAVTDGSKAVTDGSKDVADMEIDQLQQSMARLMIPRSVAIKMSNTGASKSAAKTNKQ